MKGVVIAGTGSGVGKTSITTGLLSHLSDRYNVQAYKVGPDFIDPMYHTAATGRRSRNLDSFMIRKEVMKGLVARTSEGADMCVVEGVRGLFEGISGTTDECSTAEMSKILGIPVILVVNARSLTRSAAALINGFTSFDKDVKIAGVILNNVSGVQHEKKITDAISRYSDVKVIGIIRRNTSLSIADQKLGLVIPGRDGIEDMRAMTEDLDTEQVIDSMAEMELNAGSPFIERASGIKVAIPKDKAFCFHYQENIDCMEASGAKIRMFSPADGEGLPDADMYYLGGGYPEMYAKELSENKDLIEGMKNASEEGKAVLSECGGTAVLCDNITAGKECHPMAGIFRATVSVTNVRHGPSYVISNGTPENPFFSDVRLKGHEFHYYGVETRNSTFGYDIIRGQGLTGRKDGLVTKNTVGSFSYHHSLSVEDWFGPICDRVT